MKSATNREHAASHPRALVALAEHELSAIEDGTSADGTIRITDADRVHDTVCHSAGAPACGSPGWPE